MEDYLDKLRKIVTSDSAPRVFLMGSAAILAIVVISDLAGARDRAPDVRETLRTVQAEREGAPTVPSIASVPRDLASEAVLAARAFDAPEEVVIDEEPAEDAAVEEVAEAEMTEDVVEEVAEAEVTEDAAEEVAEAEVAEDAVEEVAEAEVTEEVAEAEATEDAAEAEVVEAETTEDATEEMAEAEAAQDATEDMAEAEPVEEAAEEMAAASADMGDLSLLASANVEDGQRVWRQCAACHVYDAEQNRGGPHLVNIVGREIGAAEGWRYSRSLSEHGGVWTVESLLAWLENPDAYIPGNQMAFRGLRNEQDRINVLGFLNDHRTD